MREQEEPPPLPSGTRSRGTPLPGTGLVALGLFTAVAVWLAGTLLLLVFAGVLLGIFLRTGALLVSRYTRLPAGWSVGVFVLLLLGAATLAGWLLAPQLVRQARELSEAVPRAFSELTDRIGGTPWGEWMLEKAADGNTSQEDGAVVERAAGAASRVLDGVVAFVIVLFTGVYLAVDPPSYIRGLLRLVPIGRRRRFGEVLYAAGYQLRWWLVGQLIAMVVVGALMGFGLAIIGVPLALALGVLAGLLEFIPTLGPPLAVVPAVLLALVEGPRTAVYVVVLYSIVQTIESYLLTPLVQQRVVHLKPVVTIVAQVFFAWTAGAIGLLVAVPLVAVVQTAVQMWYVEDLLSDDLALEAEREGRKELDEARILDEGRS